MKKIRNILFAVGAVAVLAACNGEAYKGLKVDFNSFGGFINEYSINKNDILINQRKLSLVAESITKERIQEYSTYDEKVTTTYGLDFDSMLFYSTTDDTTTYVDLVNDSNSYQNGSSDKHYYKFDNTIGLIHYRELDNVKTSEILFTNAEIINYCNNNRVTLEYAILARLPYDFCHKLFDDAGNMYNFTDCCDYYGYSKDAFVGEEYYIDSEANTAQYRIEFGGNYDDKTNGGYKVDFADVTEGKFENGILLERTFHYKEVGTYYITIENEAPVTYDYTNTLKTNLNPNIELPDLSSFPVLD